LSRSRVTTFVLFGAVVLLVGSRPSSADDLDDATALYRSGQYSECVQACEKGVEEQRWRESWWHLKLRVEMDTGQYAQAAETLAEALERFPSSIRLRLVGRDVHRFNDQLEDAERMMAEIQSAVEAQRWRYADPASRIALGKFFLMLGADPRQVLESCYDRAKRSRPDYLDAHLATGELALQKHDYALAAEAFQEAAKVAPEDPAVHYGLAQSYAGSDAARAAQALAQALTLNPNHVDSLLMQADRMIDSEQYDQASDVLDKALSVNPKEPRGLAYRAVLAHLRADPGSEDKWRRAALATWSKNPEVDYLIGKKLSQKYRFKEGSQHQRQALELDPTYLPAKMQLSQDLLRLGQDDEGWRLANEVYEQDEYNVAAHNLCVLEDSLSKFRTIEADGIRLRMSEREAEIYGHRAMQLLKRARQVLCAKYEVELDCPIWSRFTRRNRTLPFAPLGCRSSRAFWVFVLGQSSRQTVLSHDAITLRVGRPCCGTSFVTR
jgi:tetratricopeptide (TPR) repeat protein